VRAQRPALKVLSGGMPEQAVAEEWAWFCGHCAAAPAFEPPLPTARVCGSCGLGILLETPLAALPNARDAFLVVDSSLRVQALSKRAESLLDVGEENAIDRSVLDLLSPADAETAGPGSFPFAIAEAAGNSNEPVSVFLRPWNTFGVRIRARIAPCGPPRAALLVLEDRPRDLRAVER
jgi:PAS domain-containing protein